jgi:hypothetical protein
MRMAPSSFTDTLYCTIGIPRIGEEYKDEV